MPDKIEIPDFNKDPDPQDQSETLDEKIKKAEVKAENKQRRANGYGTDSRRDMDHLIEMQRNQRAGE